VPSGRSTAASMPARLQRYCQRLVSGSSFSIRSDT
jgi:hypothetical protein